ncbi:hypothetical protein NQ317_013225 [Molorchus minor]|uniref:Rab3 GTPase-activating protein non-catalytic subunit n=1 Tax=Molorchus minor TaxID=1323400 RepID=A0ABQ9JRD6_9CUCU|nr:hypothetical protein NQ317_013225 [Molorchus minor]
MRENDQYGLGARGLYIIAITNERKIVILSSKCIPHSSLGQFAITYSGSIHEYDKVKSVLCVPIIGQTHNTYVGPEWTCIIVGYDSGFVRFYTEHCELLMQEQFHCENITSIKCQSQHNPRPDISPDLHPKKYIYNIRAMNCRDELIKGRSDLPEIPRASLAPKKWGFQDQAGVHDTAVVGLNLSSTFDHLLTASTCGGFDTKYRTMPPNNTLVMAVGSRPFLGYHYALEGGSQPVFSDVAKVVANKLRSALPGWLTGNKPQVEKQTISFAMQPAEAMGCRFGLCDLRRSATNLILSSDHKLAAVNDALGRVLLVDSFKGITLRIFKGYRDAQCSFIQIPEERKSKHRIGNKVAQFLVIYSPKKGMLEVFSVQQGCKIATFTASKFSKLLYISYGLMGFTNTSKSRYICPFTTVFIDNDGQVKEILIPFHFALEEKNNKQARDIHLYKKLRQLIKSGDFNEEMLTNAVHNTCTELKTVEMKSQIVDMLLNNKGIPVKVSLQCVQYFLENLVDEDSVNLKIICENATILLKFYKFLTSNSVNYGILKEEIKTSKIIIKNLFELLINYWVNRSLYINLNLEKEMNNLLQTIYALVQTAGEDMVTKYNEKSNFWSEIRDILANSSRPFPALTAAILCKQVAQKIDLELPMGESADSIEDDSIEVLSNENIQWALLIASKPTIKEPTLLKLQHEKSNISLKYILMKGNGSVSELVAQWLTLGGINPELINAGEHLYKNSDNYKIELKDECELKEEIDKELIEKEPILKSLNLLKSKFPYSLEASNLLANMAWEYAMTWQRDIQDLGNLEAAIKCSNCILNIQIKQVGKLPEDRLCQQGTGLSNFQVSSFIKISTDFLDSFMDIAQQIYTTSKLDLKFENIWENGGQSLVVLAAQQQEVNYDLLHLHYQLSLVLQMIATFSVKHTKPFLFKIISASLESVTVTHDGKIYSMEHVNWMAKCVSLARIWNLEVDLFKRFQIVQLFSNGFDNLAEELIPAVNNVNELGLQLLDIAKKRLAHENQSALSPQLTQSMESMDVEWCAPSDISGIENLTTHTLRCLDENQIEYKIAQLILEACSTLKETRF